MKLLRKTLFPFSILYGFITQIRNYLYDKGILKSYSFEIPIIVVGNLSVGGTGKTPQIEYLIRLLSDHYKIATLSRGYKRESKGFVLANANATAKTLGDEPYQFYKKFKNILVAVDADRKNGIKQLLNLAQKPDVILLDDAFQHRKVKAGFYVLLTAYQDLFVDDFVLPSGNLRELRKNCNRAHAIVVTKCPINLSTEKQNEIEIKINTYSKNTMPVFFSSIEYDDYVYSYQSKINLHQVQQQSKILVAGIANPDLFFNILHANNDVQFRFPDHHNFTEKDLQNITSKAKNIPIITTEKDFVRLADTILMGNLYYLPIKTNFLNHKKIFNNLIINYLKKSIL